MKSQLEKVIMAWAGNRLIILSAKFHRSIQYLLIQPRWLPAIPALQNLRKMNRAWVSMTAKVMLWFWPQHRINRSIRKLPSFWITDLIQRTVTETFLLAEFVELCNCWNLYCAVVMFWDCSQSEYCTLEEYAHRIRIPLEKSDIRIIARKLQLLYMIDPTSYNFHIMLWLEHWTSVQDGLISSSKRSRLFWTLC